MEEMDGMIIQVEKEKQKQEKLLLKEKEKVKNEWAKYKNLNREIEKEKEVFINKQLKNISILKDFNLKTEYYYFSPYQGTLNSKEINKSKITSFSFTVEQGLKVMLADYDILWGLDTVFRTKKEAKEAFNKNIDTQKII
jgi:hypothetical protein